MKHFDAQLMVASRESDSKVLRMAISLKYFHEEKANGKCNVTDFSIGLDFTTHPNHNPLTLTLNLNPNPNP